jgi:hypothetical protein
MHIIVFFQTPLRKLKSFDTNLKWKPCELISCNTITTLFQNISDCCDLNICGNAYVLKVQISMPNFCFKRSTHKMNSIWRSRCYNKLEFPKSIIIQMKDQMKKMEKTKHWNLAHQKAKHNKKNPNGRTINRWHAWGMGSHLVRWGWDSMVGYKFDVTWICSAKEPVKIKFCKKNHSNIEKEGEREWADAKHVKQYFCT